jgi:hypothetical protein
MFQFSSGEPHGEKQKKLQKSMEKTKQKKIHVKEATTKTPCEMEAFYFHVKRKHKKPM